MTSAPSRFFPTWLAPLLVALLLGLQYWMAVSSKQEESTTSDELVHLTGGFTYWQFNDYRMHPENGNLPQRWAALPAWLGGAHPPALESEYWHKSDVWMFGHEFFYTSGNDHVHWLAAGRAMIALFASATGLLIFCWARRLWGLAGAFTALGFYVFCPTFLAHGALMTSDMCMTFFFLASVGAYWRHLHRGSATAWVLSALVFGLACVAKFSAALILPMMVLMALVRIWHDEPLQFGRRVFTMKMGKAGAIVLSTFGQGLVAVAVIWLFYGFRYSAFNPNLPAAEHFIRPWDWVRGNIGLQGKIIGVIASLKLLPEAFLYGYAYVVESAIARGAFLDGDYSIYGWVSFFPKTFLYKTPVPLMLALVTGVTLTLLHWRTLAAPRLARIMRQLYRLTPLLVLFAVYWIFSLTTHLNIGHRHILPTYPVLFILLGLLGYSAVQALPAQRNAGLVLAAITVLLLGWFIDISWRIRPHYLAYFNEIAGGPENGYKHLVDSSLDWGQDLPGLKAWVDTHRRPGEPFYLSYFGTSVPDYYHLDAVMMPSINEFRKPRPWYWIEPGIYAVSATMLQQVYMPNRGLWLPADEQAYQELRRFDPGFRALKADPYGHPELMAHITPAQWGDQWQIYDLKRFARLCHYLRARRPDAMIGYSILIFRLNQTEIDDALNGPASRLANAIERELNAPASSHDTP